MASEWNDMLDRCPKARLMISFNDCSMKSASPSGEITPIPAAQGARGVTRSKGSWRTNH